MKLIAKLTIGTFKAVMLGIALSDEKKRNALVKKKFRNCGRERNY